MWWWVVGASGNYQNNLEFVNMDYFCQPQSFLNSVAAVQNPSLNREDRLTKYFSDANVVNLVGCVWQSPPSPLLPIHQEQLLGARLTCHHHHASHQLSCQTPSNLL